MLSKANINKTIKEYKLKELALFSELNTEQMEQVKSICSISGYSKNEIIFKEGSSYKGFYIVLKGTIKVYKKTLQEKEITLHLVKSYNAFADTPLFEGKTYPVNAQAVEDSTLIFVPGEEFKKLLLENSSICYKMLAGFAKRMRELTKKVEDLTFKDVTNRLIEFIVEEVKRSGTEKLPEPFIKLTISKKTLASYLSTITETLSRSLHKLEKEGLIRIAGRKIFIENLTGLKNYGG